MSTSDMKDVLKSLSTLCLGSVDEQSGAELGKIFETCTLLKLIIDNCSTSSSDDKIQVAVHVCIQALEKCTMMVNELGLFSNNETADELQTSSMKYLLLPAYLGSFHLLLKPKDGEDRLSNVQKADVYFKDYILRCTNYELCGTSSKDLKDIFDCEEASETQKESSTDPELRRRKKIERFKRRKVLEDKEKLLSRALGRADAEDSIREFYLTLIEKWLIIAEEELENSEKEKELLNWRAMTGENKFQKVKKRPDVQPLKPIIITKNEVQKQVFGLGYPSIPVLTVNDFYRQRFEKQIQEQKENELEKQRQQKKGKSLQESALSGEALSKEDEDLQKEALLEKDDPEALARARHWDDWKDENPRGAGNRYNKG
ncbi:hypothetical protein JTE90_017610 [Oedothorax gibbosus]|uniref:Immunoglobulin-binding protein 1 n=1 Tax=Oedothorax gibbosus TaxID=931172 RepID=A0AAV6U4Z9_9ARAC|nr:hypothetical protein JTE90_017610 [Oedothorax gibbosus]